MSRAGLAACPRGAHVGHAGRPLRRGRLALAIALFVALAGCAPSRPTVPGPPKFPDFVVPDVPADLQKLEAASRGHRAAWASLQAGDLRAAERGFEAVLKRQPAFYPSEAGAGYVRLAGEDYQQALRWFDRAAGHADGYAPALVGRGEALLGLGRDVEALAAFERALSVNPDLPDIGRRVEVLRFRAVQDAIASAQTAAREGRLADAQAAYATALAASPESAFLYRELAAVEQRLGDSDRALQHVREAIARDPSDGASQLLLGELLEARSDWEGAGKAYASARALGVAADVDARIDRVNERAALAKLPEEYRAIPQAERITRADLAALLGVRLDDLLRATGSTDPVLVTDTRGSWAQPWIADVTRAGLMEVYSNHTFQPRAVVRRSDLAQAASRVLTVIASRDPELARAWTSTPQSFSDVSPGHLSYRAASAAVAAGVMRTVDGDAFRPSRSVSGAEAVEAVSRLETLAARVAGKGSR